MREIFEIPLRPRAEEFQIEVAGKEWTIRTHWNAALQRWTIDIGRSASDWLIRNLSLVAGHNLLSPFSHLSFGFGLWLQVDGDSEGEATEENLGTEGRLLAVIE